uniref:Uncharacterized protein n=2 Tax=Pan TaxID=9596 RepID=G2HI69_PANTR|nr:hypothetical protein [Pan troglodytes]
MSRASFTSSSSWYSASCCCITSRISVISCSLASSIFRNLSRSPAMASSSSRMRSSAALACGGGGRRRSGQPVGHKAQVILGLREMGPHHRLGQRPGLGMGRTGGEGRGIAGRPEGCIRCQEARAPRPAHPGQGPEVGPGGRQTVALRSSPASGGRRAGS